jgi:formiminotetrahydrofolate cyclodeaminase
MFRTQTVTEFLEALAARTPTPGGGVASALAGAIGVAQASMCAAFTSQNERYKDVEAEAVRIRARLEGIRTRFLDLMDEDAQAYQGLLAARRLPKGSAAEKQARATRLAAAEEEATRVPEQILATAHEALALTRTLADFCNPNLIADMAVTAWLLEAAARGAALQVRGNLKGQPGAAGRAARAHETARACEESARAIQTRVLQSMGLPDDTRK